MEELGRNVKSLVDVGWVFRGTSDFQVELVAPIFSFFSPV